MSKLVLDTLQINLTRIDSYSLKEVTEMRAIWVLKICFWRRYKRGLLKKEFIPFEISSLVAVPSYINIWTRSLKFEDIGKY